MIVDANNLILGRMATVVAKKALLGNKIDIVNCEKAVVSGSKIDVISRYKARQQKGGHKKGPFFPKRPDHFVRRTIRGMLPYKTARGKEAFGRVKCYIGIPKEFEGKKPETIKQADVSKLPNLDYGPVWKICQELGAKI